MTPMLSIVADIGGTNTRVALADGRNVRPDSIAKYRNADHAGIGAVLARFMAERGVSDVDGVCVAAAGPVSDGVAVMTNLNWTIDSAALASATKAELVAVLNDLQAQGHALGQIAPSHLRAVIPGAQKDRAAMLVVGLGTGVNAAPVHDTPWGRIVPPSECGHITMPVRDADDLNLARFVETYGDHAHGFAGVEDVLSGRGLERVYAFVATQAGTPAPLSSDQIMAALAKGDALAQTAAAHYIRILGQELGNLALVHLPLGGIYLIGGMARAMTPYFATMGLTDAFHDKGRFSDFMRNFAVTVVEDDFAALTGCATYLANGGKG